MIYIHFSKKTSRPPPSKMVNSVNQHITSIINARGNQLQVTMFNLTSD